jgi:hypothetical protein
MASISISLHIGNAVPPGNETESAQVISLWQQISDHLQHCTFTGPEQQSDARSDVKVHLDVSELLARLKHCVSEAGSFDAWHKRHIEQPETPVDATLIVHIDSERSAWRESEGYLLATIILQQLVLAANIALPGSVQFLKTQFAGEGGHRFEAQEFDARILYGARKAASYNDWPHLQVLSFDKVWQWLERCGTSRTTTAISSINKTLFTLLKVAEQRHESSARTVLLVIYQLEQLLDCRQANSLDLIHSRARMILGSIPEAADSLNELAHVRSSLFLANQPVHRPPLISHNATEALRDQMGQHNSAVEAGTAMVLALVHDLIDKNATAYEFTESFSRQ